MFDYKGRQFHRPAVTIYGHSNGSEVTALKQLKDGHRLLSRGLDDSMKMFDIRLPKNAIHEWKDLPN